MGLPERVRLQVVDPDARERVVGRPEGFDSGRADQVELVAGDNRRLGDVGLCDASPPDRVEFRFIAWLVRRYQAVFPLDFKAAGAGRPDCERIPHGRIREAALDAHPEAARAGTEPALDFAESSADQQGVGQREPEGVGDEGERVEEIALAGAIRAYEEREARKRNVARANTLVVVQDYAGQEARLRHRRRPLELILEVAAFG